MNLDYLNFITTCCLLLIGGYLITKNLTNLTRLAFLIFWQILIYSYEIFRFVIPHCKIVDDIPTTSAANVTDNNGSGSGSSSGNGNNAVNNNRTNGNNNNETTMKSPNFANRNNKNNTNVHELPKPRYILYPRKQLRVGWLNSTRKWQIGAGFINVGNTCYLNSTLQALMHVPSLANYLLTEYENGHLEKCAETDNSCTICSMVKTLEATQSSPTPIRPDYIYPKLKTICKQMIMGRQEDAHEFLRYLLDSMERSYLSRFREMKMNLDPISKQTTPISQIFGGYLRSTVRCLSCDHVSVTFQHFQDLLVDIAKVDSVDQALDQFFARERLEDMCYVCESCKRKVCATKQFSLERPPIALCIQLKRFNPIGSKCIKSIMLSQQIELTRYSSSTNKLVCNNNNNNNNKLTYNFVSMVTHVGSSMHAGHYTASCITPNGSCYTFDDASVRYYSMANTINTHAYIIFYEMDQETAKRELFKTELLGSAINLNNNNNNNNNKHATENGQNNQNNKRKYEQMVNGNGNSNNNNNNNNNNNSNNNNNLVQFFGPELPPSNGINHKPLSLINGNNNSNNQIIFNNKRTYEKITNGNNNNNNNNKVVYGPELPVSNGINPLSLLNGNDNKQDHNNNGDVKINTNNKKTYEKITNGNSSKKPINLLQEFEPEVPPAIDNNHHNDDADDNNHVRPLALKNGNSEHHHQNNNVNSKYNMPNLHNGDKSTTTTTTKEQNYNNEPGTSNVCLSNGLNAEAPRLNSKNNSTKYKNNNNNNNNNNSNFSCSSDEDDAADNNNNNSKIKKHVPENTLKALKLLEVCNNNNNKNNNQKLVPYESETDDEMTTNISPTPNNNTINGNSNRSPSTSSISSLTNSLSPMSLSPTTTTNSTTTVNSPNNNNNNKNNNNRQLKNSTISKQASKTEVIDHIFADVFKNKTTTTINTATTTTTATTMTNDSGHQQNKQTNIKDFISYTPVSSTTTTTTTTTSSQQQQKLVRCSSEELNQPTSQVIKTKTGPWRVTKLSTITITTTSSIDGLHNNITSTTVSNMNVNKNNNNTTADNATTTTNTTTTTTSTTLTTTVSADSIPIRPKNPKNPFNKETSSNFIKQNNNNNYNLKRAKSDSCVNNGGDCSSENGTTKKLLKQSYRGYGTNILTWNGSQSTLDKEIQAEQEEQLKKDWEEDEENEMDRGRQKKTGGMVVDRRKVPAYNAFQMQENLRKYRNQRISHSTNYQRHNQFNRNRLHNNNQRFKFLRNPNNYSTSRNNFSNNYSSQNYSENSNSINNSATKINNAVDNCANIDENFNKTNGQNS